MRKTKNIERAAANLYEIKTEGNFVWPPFSIGAFLCILECLPEFSRKVLNDRYKISGTYLSRLENFQRDFMSREVQEDKVDIFAKKLAGALFENDFFCDNDQEILQHVLRDLVHDVLVNDKDLGHEKRSKAQNLTEVPSSFLLGGNDKEFYSQCCESIYQLCKISIFAERNKRDENDTLLWEKWEKYLPEVKGVFKRYLEEKTKNPETSLLFPILPKEKTSAVPQISDEALRQKRRQADEAAKQIFQPGNGHMNLTAHNLRQARDYLTDGRPMKGYKDHIESFSLPLSSGYIILNYQQVIACGKDEPTLTIDRFVIHTDIDLIRIPDEMTALHRNLGTINLALKRESIMAGYKPFSFRKVHIASMYKGDIDPGYEQSFKWHMDIAPIEYFDHLAVRRFLKNELAQMGVNALCSTSIRDKYDTYVYVNTMGFRDIASFYMLAGCGAWVLSKDGYLMVSLRGKLMEKPGILGYSAAGSCEYFKRLATSGEYGDMEANPFLTIKREIREECKLEVEVDELELVAFGFDYERYLQQFSFFHHSKYSADEIISKSQTAVSTNEQTLCALPFNNAAVTLLLSKYELEPGAVVSLLNICNKYEDLMIE